MLTKICQNSNFLCKTIETNKKNIPEFEDLSKNTIITSSTFSSTEQIITQTRQANKFELYFKLYYVDSSKNSQINFDSYLSSALKLISLFPNNLNFSQQINEKKIYLPEYPQKNKTKKTIILDMDETLLHADVNFQYKYHNEMLKFSYDNNEILIPLILRPYLFEFLDIVSEQFELVVFTASVEDYADAILNYIEKDKKYFAKRLYRESCIYLHPGIYIKDLNIFTNRELKDIVIVDNSVFSFSNQLNNGILINSFFNDKDDDMLLSLISYLKLLNSSDDVREVNKDTFKYEKYLNEFKKEFGSLNNITE